MKITTRHEARLQNLKRFYTGVLCGRKHRSERYVSSGNCIDCVAMLRRPKKSTRPPGARREAYERGLALFDTGKACRRGHRSLRYVKNGACVECCKPLPATHASVTLRGTAQTIELVLAYHALLVEGEGGRPEEWRGGPHLAAYNLAELQRPKVGTAARRAQAADKVTPGQAAANLEALKQRHNGPAWMPPVIEDL